MRNVKLIKNSLSLTLLFVAVFLIVVISLSVVVKKQIASNKETTEVVPEVIVPDTVPFTTKVVIGTSVEGRVIEAYTFGTGDIDILFVGGIHGGYEYNSVALAENIISQLDAKTISVPSNVTVHIIPALNPDGVMRVLEDSVTNYADGAFPGGAVDGTGRFNANNVDLNRNFGCKWQPESSWKGNVVSAGTSAFSEPEAQALRNYVNLISPQSVVFWHSKAGNVYASECQNGVLSETLTIMNLYAQAGNYGAVPVFDAYEVTGDAEGWLASVGIPAITVELETRESMELDRNISGVRAILKFYGN